MGQPALLLLLLQRLLLHPQQSTLNLLLVHLPLRLPLRLSMLRLPLLFPQRLPSCHPSSRIGLGI